uniref:Major facilitator superfamily (MFS) profile domain-containing protein n=1 Tax=Ditylenchus dipsaci TaxID=166011 RepID=A0A915DZA5_9BILA
MLDDEDQDNSHFNSTHQPSENRYSYVQVPLTRNALFAATAIGSLLGAMPLTYFSSKFTLRVIFTIYGLLSGLSSLLTPLAAYYGFWPLFVMRLFQGAGVSMFYFAISAINESWAPLASSATIMNSISCNNQLGVILIMPLAGGFCESSFGWSGVDSPKIHRCISDKELKKIEAGKHDSQQGYSQSVPYKAILSDKVVWAAMIALFCDAIGFQVFTQYGPLYLNKALNINIRETGFSAALPSVLTIFVKLFAGPLYDKMKCSQTIRVKFFTSLCELGMAFCFFALTILQSIKDCPAWVLQIFFTASTPFSGMNFLGVVKCATLISGKFSPVLMAWYTLIDGSTVLILPLLVNFFAPDGTLYQWGILFAGFGVIEVLAALLFDLLADAEPRKWSKTQTKKDDVKQELK